MQTLSHGFNFGGVTFCQLFPPSRVMWIKPSSVPAQIVSTSLNEGATAEITPRCLPFSGSDAANAPKFPGISYDVRVRSGLITCQLFPASVVLKSTLAAKYSVCGSSGEKTTGNVRA